MTTTKDSKHWANQSEAAQDEVRDFVEEAVDWLIVRRREAAMALGGAAVVVAIGSLVYFGRQARANAAWDKLSQAELYAYSGHVPEAQTLLTQITDEGGAPAASAMAYLMQGDLLYPRAQYDQALAAYDKAAQSSTDALRPYALADKVMTLQAAGKASECVSAAQSFLDATPDHLMTPQVHAAMARCQMALGQMDAAKATLQRISLQYPNTPWAEWAASRLAPPTPPK